MKYSVLPLLVATVSLNALALTGKVVDEQGNAITDAQIKLIETGEVTRSNTQGQFVFSHEHVDEIHIRAPGYSHQILHLHGDYDEALTIVLKRTVLEQVDVIGLPIHASTIESVQPVSVLGGEDLRNKQASTLGETLKNEVGVHSTYFGPVSSSPIIRGLDGPRVLITQNGLDASDASRVGPDHNVATEASTAKQVEILRGPATLFYGSGAIGGVINIVDDRVPSDSESKAAFSIVHNSVADENELSAAYTGGNEAFAFHVDGFWRDGDNYEIPGLAELETEEEHEEEGHEEHEEGILENSDSESQGFNIGGSVLLDNGYIGLSYGRLERLNGIPGHSEEAHGEEEHEEEEHEEESVKSDLEQDRWQLISELSIDSELISSINSRLAYTDYEHRELHGDEVGTTFKNQTTQVRVDVLHNELAGWRGALSFDGKFTDFEAVGEEAFTPPSETDTLAIALMEEKHSDNFLWQVGARIERVELDADDLDLASEHGSDADHDSHSFDSLSFTPFSLSSGFVWDFAPSYNVGVSVTRAERAPSASELFSAGPHIAARTYELGALFEVHQEGDEAHIEFHGDVKEEVSNNLDISLRKHEGDVGFIFNVFYNQVDDFYYQRDTGLTTEDLFEHEGEHEEGEEEVEEEHGHEFVLPVYIFEQEDAKFYGVEAELVWQVNNYLKWTLWGDSIRGKLEDAGNIPRMPPKRLGNQFNFEYKRWWAEIGVTHHFEQDNIAVNETITDDYTMVDVQVSYRFPVMGGDISAFVKVNNITDEEGRVHSSFLKDQAPLPGRGFSFGLRGSF